MLTFPSTPASLGSCYGSTTASSTNPRPLQPAGRPAAAGSLRLRRHSARNLRRPAAAAAQGGDPSEMPKVPAEEALPGSHEAPSPPAPEGGSQRAQRMARAEEHAAEMGRKGTAEGGPERSAAEGGVTVSEVDAAEKRHEGILQAIDELQHAEQGQQAHHERPASPAGAGERPARSEPGGETLRPEGREAPHAVPAVEELEGVAKRRAAAQQEERGGLAEEGLSTMQPGDIMPRPGDKHLPHALRQRSRPDYGPTSRLNSSHSRTGRPFTHSTPGNHSIASTAGPTAIPLHSRSSPGPRLVARAVPAEPDRAADYEKADQRAEAAADPVAEEVYDDQIELSGAPGGGPSNMAATELDIADDATQDNQAEVPEEEGLPIEQEAARGADAMFYYKSGRQENEPAKPQEPSARAAMGSKESMDPARSADANHEARKRVLGSLQSRSEERVRNLGPVEEINQRRTNARELARELARLERRNSWSRVLEITAGRSALLGVIGAVGGENLTGQSVLSQIAGRFEAGRQVEFSVPWAQQAAAAVVLGVLVLTLGEQLFSRLGAPTVRFFGLGPSGQVWLGRASMGLFGLLLAHETLHSNRPLFGTLFYTWF